MNFHIFTFLMKFLLQFCVYFLLFLFYFAQKWGGGAKAPPAPPPARAQLGLKIERNQTLAQIFWFYCVRLPNSIEPNHSIKFDYRTVRAVSSGRIAVLTVWKNLQSDLHQSQRVYCLCRFLVCSNFTHQLLQLVRENGLADSSIL